MVKGRGLSPKVESSGAREQGLRTEDMVVGDQRDTARKVTRQWEAAEILRSQCTQGLILTQVGVGERGEIIKPLEKHRGRETERGDYRHRLRERRTGRGTEYGKRE